MDEKTALDVLRDKLDDLIETALARCDEVTVGVARAIYGGLPAGYQKQLGVEWDELAEAITQYDVAVDAAARGASG